MKTLIAIALATAVLFAVALPAAAFSTKDFADKGVAWQKTNARIIRNMSNVKVGTRRLIDATDPYIRYLRRINPTATQCQKEAGFYQHQLHVLRYGINLINTWQALDRGHNLAARRYVKAAMRHFTAADTLGARVIRRCW